MLAVLGLAVQAATVSLSSAVCQAVVLVVEGVVAEAAVEDADEPVGEGAEGLVVGGAAGAVAVVVGAGAG